ncbi:MAG TPA: LamG-like jellyroll fold domain-containing protein [Verrucomicrobiae bacterium]|jgi:hypothetical protein
MTNKKCVLTSAGAIVLAIFLNTSSGGAAAIQFDGVNDVVSIPDNASIRITGPITVEAWINRSAAGVQHSIVEKYGCAAGQGGYVLRVTAADKLLFGTRDDCNNGSSVLGASTISANTWTHVAGSWDGATMRVYVNGNLDGSLSATRNPKAGNTPLKIGERGNGGTPLFGAIDDVRLWNVARTAAQIQAGKDVCLAGNEAGLAGYWRFDEADGLIALDSTANHNNGTLNNGPLWLALGAPISCGATPPLPPTPTPGLLPTVRIAATMPVTAEFFPDGIHALIPGGFTVWRTGSTAADLTVNFAVTGTASNGIDYNDIGASITIPAGSASAVIPILPMDDFLIEGPETVVVTLATNAAYLVGVPGFDTVTIDDNDPTVSIVATDALASEAGLDPAMFTLFRTGPTTDPLPVFYRVQGSARVGQDYVSIGSGAIIPAGQSSTTVTLAPLNDALVDGPKNVLVRLEADPTYTIGLGLAEAIIADDDMPDAPSASVLVSVVCTFAATEFFADAIHTNIPGVFTIYRTGPTANPLTVNYTMSGMALNGVDYEMLPGTITLPAGATTGQVLLYTIDDALVEGLETAILALSPGPNYALGALPSATMTITDNDPTVSIDPIDSLATEAGDPGTFRISRTGPTTAPLLVAYRQVGTATPGLDYIDPSDFVVIPAGSSFLDVRIMPIEDALFEGTESVEFRLAKLAGYTVGAGSAIIDLADNDVPLPPPATVGIAATVATVSEAGPGPAIFTVTRAGLTTLPLTVGYSLGGTAIIGSDYFPPAAPVPGTVVIPAGATSAIIPILPIDDPFVEGSETVIVTLLPSFDYTIGVGAGTATVVITDNDTAPLPPPPPPQGLTALQLNGANQSVQIPNSPSVQITGPITVEAWINRAVTGVQHSIVEKYGCAGLGGYVLRVTANDKLLFGTRDDCNNGTSVVGVTTLAANTWYHVAGVWDGTALRIYLNGVLDTTALPTTRNPKAGTTPLKIGERGNGGTPFNGLIDDVRLWNLARTDAQILADKNHCLPGNTAGLAGNWRLDEGAGAVAGDATANGNHGALVNNPLWVISTAPTTCP